MRLRTLLLQRCTTQSTKDAAVPPNHARSFSFPLEAREKDRAYVELPPCFNQRRALREAGVALLPPRGRRALSLMAANDQLGYCRLAPLQESPPGCLKILSQSADLEEQREPADLRDTGAKYSPDDRDALSSTRPQSPPLHAFRSAPVLSPQDLTRNPSVD